MKLCNVQIMNYCSKVMIHLRLELFQKCSYCEANFYSMQKDFCHCRKNTYAILYTQGILKATAIRMPCVYSIVYVFSRQ